MIINSEQRKDKLERRVKVKTLDNIFYTVIKEGTNCLAFEARTILENARRMNRLGDYQARGKKFKTGPIKDHRCLSGTGSHILVNKHTDIK
jgi:hypothetical protein